MPDDFEELRAKLPPWTLILTISGLLRRPEEKIAYEEKFLAEVLKNEFPKMGLTDNLHGFPGLGRKLMPMLREPWPSRPALLEEPGKRRMPEPVLHHETGTASPCSWRLWNS